MTYLRDALERRLQARCGSDASQRSDVHKGGWRLVLSVALGIGFGPLAVYGAKFSAEH